MEPSSSRNRKVATLLDIELPRKVAEIESILGYTFRKKSLLAEAITHGSCAGHPSYRRLEFVGDAVLGLVVSYYLYVRYPHIGSDDLTTLRHANVSNEKLARVAVRLGLYRFLRRNSPGLDEAVREFTDNLATAEEDGKEGSRLKAPKVLADMVESIAAAVYWDCNSDLKLVWKIFKKLLKPFVTLETMKEHPHPVAALYVLCQKQGKATVPHSPWFTSPSNLWGRGGGAAGLAVPTLQQKQGKALEFRSSSFGSRHTVLAIVDGMVMGTGSARQVAIAKQNAARDALSKLSGVEDVTSEEDEDEDECDGDDVDDGQNLHKQRSYVYCDKKRWIKPLYN